MNYPRISIVTCVYNGEKYISKLLESVLNMGYPNIEHIIIDDGSTDSTEDIVLSYANSYREKNGSSLYIKYIKQQNMGLGGATNIGLKAITGEYWTWINCDDWYEPKAFNNVVDYYKTTNADVVFLNRYIVKIDNNILTKKIEIPKKRWASFKNKTKLKKMLYAYKFPQLHFLIKSSSFDAINPSRSIDPYRYTQDTQLSSIIIANLKTSFFEKPSTNYFLRDESLLSNALNHHGVNGFIISRINSLDMLELPQQIVESEKSVFIINWKRDLLLSFFKNNKKEEYRHLYNDIRKNEKYKVIFKHRKFIIKDVSILYYLSFLPFSWLLIRRILF